MTEFVLFQVPPTRQVPEFPPPSPSPGVLLRLGGSGRLGRSGVWWCYTALCCLSCCCHCSVTLICPFLRLNGWSAPFGWQHKIELRSDIQCRSSQFYTDCLCDFQSASSRFFVDDGSIIYQLNNLGFSIMCLGIMLVYSTAVAVALHTPLQHGCCEANVAYVAALASTVRAFKMIYHIGLFTMGLCWSLHHGSLLSSMTTTREVMMMKITTPATTTGK